MRLDTGIAEVKDMGLSSFNSPHETLFRIKHDWFIVCVCTHLLTAAAVKLQAAKWASFLGWWQPAWFCDPGYLFRFFSIQRVLLSGAHLSPSGLHSHFPSVPWYCPWTEGFPSCPTECLLFVAYLCLGWGCDWTLCGSHRTPCCSWSCSQGTSHNPV